MASNFALGFVGAISEAYTYFPDSLMEAEAFIGLGIAMVTGTAYGQLCAKFVEFKHKGICLETVGQLLKVVSVSLVINGISSLIISLIASQLTVGAGLALVGMAVIGVFADVYMFTKIDLIKFINRKCTTILGIVGILMHLGPTNACSGNVLNMMRLGFTGTGVAIIVGTIASYMYPRDINKEIQKI